MIAAWNSFMFVKNVVFANVWKHISQRKYIFLGIETGREGKKLLSQVISLKYLILYL